MNVHDATRETREANAHAWDAYHNARRTITESRALEALALKAFRAHMNALAEWECKHK